MIKKRIACIFVCMLSLAVLNGCGNRADIKKLDDDTLLESAINGSIEAGEEFNNRIHEENMEKKEKKLEGDERFVLCEPASEIENSVISDELVQIGEVVFKNDGSLTVGELLDKLQANGKTGLCDEYGNLYFEDFEIEDGIIRGDYNLCDELGNKICSIMYNVGQNETVYNCQLIDVIPYGSSISQLNVFYAGNICPGIYMDAMNSLEEEAISRRLEDYSRLNLSEAKEYLKSKGAERIYVMSDMAAYVECSKKPIYEENGEEYYRIRECVFLDANDGDETHRYYVSTSFVTKDSFERVFENIESIYGENLAD